MLTEEKEKSDGGETYLVVGALCRESERRRRLTLPSPESPAWPIRSAETGEYQHIEVYETLKTPSDEAEVVNAARMATDGARLYQRDWVKAIPKV